MASEVLFPLWSEDDSLDHYVSECRASAAAAKSEAVLTDCITLLEAFCRENFLGPPTGTEDPVPGTSPVGIMTTTEGHRLCVDRLLCDGEVLPISTRRPLLLIVAIEGLEQLEGSPVVHYWRLRTYFTYQRVLSRKAHSLRQKLGACIEALQGITDKSGLPIDHIAQLHLEIGHVYSFYREVSKGEEAFHRAQKATRIETELTGVMGVRTEHQSFKTAQLALVVRAIEPAEPFKEPHPGARVRTIQGSDCNVLQRPSQRNLVFKEVDPSEEAAAINLAHIDQAVLMALCHNVRNNNPHHGLTGREMLAYVERVMGCTNMTYTIEIMCLSLKAKLEWERSRVQERALLQLQEMVDAFVMEDGDSFARFPFFFAVLLPSYTGMLKDLGKRYQKIGMAKTAESVGEILQDWEFVVACCLQQGNDKRAEKIARDMLEKEPDNPLHWCALAEATRSKEHFLTAWEKGKHKLAAPMRGLARLCVEREEWDECVGYFDKCLELNPMYGGNWFTLGVACQRTERYERACYAFTRVVMLEPEEGQAWNNLGSVYLKLGKKTQAFQCMTMAAKLMDYSWRVRENHFRIANDLEEWQIAMNDLLLLVEAQGHRYKMDIQDFTILCRGLAKLLLTDGYQPACTSEAITTVVDQGDGEIPALVVTPVPGTVPMEAGSLRNRVELLLTKVNGSYTDNAGIYAATAEFYETVGEHQRAHEFYLKQDRAAKISDWKTDPELFAGIVDIATNHSRIALKLGDIQSLSQSSRMALNSIKGAQENFAEHELMSKLKEIHKQVDSAQKAALGV